MSKETQQLSDILNPPQQAVAPVEAALAGLDGGHRLLGRVEDVGQLLRFLGHASPLVGRAISVRKERSSLTNASRISLHAPLVVLPQIVLLRPPRLRPLRRLR